MTPSHADWLDDLLFKHGPERGRLMAVLELLTDLDTALATHMTYCRVSPAARGPATDLAQARSSVAQAKAHLAHVLHAPRSA